MPNPSFKSFLSHSYKSAAINLYFFNIFKEIAEVQFDIDKGISSTNVTRLERMIRNSDAFIGIYPFIDTLEGSFSFEELKKQSRYFRLEIDLAIRSQKPAIIFYDERYENLISIPDNIFSHSFNSDEITGTGGFPNLNRHRGEFEIFCKSVFRKKDYDDVLPIKKNTVAIALSAKLLSYSDKIKSLLLEHNFSNVQIINFPTNLDTRFFNLLAKVDFAIVDQRGPVAESGLPAYLHGQFIPMVRINGSENTADSNSNALSNFLYNGVEVGYIKDAIDCTNEEALLIELASKLKSINSAVKRINTFAEAEKYFLGATLRKEAVFVSYSGKDVVKAKEIINSLKQHYQQVFDYRDGESIKPGKPWLAEIFDKLAKSAIGINLLSNSYIESGNCMHEAQQMVAHLDNKQIKLFPIKLYEEAINLPAFFGTTQYMRVVDYSNINDLVSKIVHLSSE